MKILLLLILVNIAFANEKRGGDDAGNGGFAYKQSIKILELASTNVLVKINNSSMKELIDHPDWKNILVQTLTYNNLQKNYKKDGYRGGKKLQMDYQVNPPVVKIMKAYYESFMGRADSEIPVAELEVEKRLLHEASHIWGYKENQSEEFANKFLALSNNEGLRASNDITIQDSFCVCLDGKSQVTKFECNNICSEKPKANTPKLYIDVVLGSETLKNPHIKNLYDWCNKQLVSDYGIPNCSLEASAKESSIDNIPVSIKNNSLEADLSMLNYNTKYTINIVESKSSNARSELFEFTNVKREEEKIVKLNTTFLSEYFCLNFGGKVDTEGNVSRDFSFKTYHYFPKLELPLPIPSNMSESIVCHDETKYGKGDDALYPRLGLVNDRISIFEKTDPMFIYENQRTKVSNKIIQAMYEKTGAVIVNEFFQMLNVSNEPLGSSSLGGYYTIPFVDTNSNLANCPNGNSDLEIEIQKYTGKMEGLYLGQAEQSTPNQLKLPNIYLTETNLVDFGFYVNNGFKIKVQNSYQLHTRTIFIYYPFNKNLDPMQKGDRNLFTIINENNFGFKTSDKRIGCIPVKVTQSNVGKISGESCQSDYECNSLCCDNRIGACKPHDGKNMFCEKQPGDMCITGVFCEKENVQVCRLYKSGTRADGKISCQVRCKQELKYGDCVNGLCNAPKGQEDTSIFDLENCTGAIDP